ncbi:hypothetical protein LMG30113_07400 [Burkholderia paludis]|nr:hypothetical protein LMG30113_07400 [Burkholderia paludis]
MLRPSGVSSASDDNCAASASASSVTNGAGTNADAWRLPSVIVPVLSSSSTSTSPAASTARPDVAITFACIIRLMPATPIADSRPPIVVGIRHTSSATSAVIVTTWPAFIASTANVENGSSVAVASSITIVSATSRIVSAISFGVFLRFAPSTIAIMRSRNASPGLTATRTTIQSDSTRVPPVTDEKSPPDSRITGADSPVIADSSTDATPSITSPSAGIVSPASTSTTSPLRRSVDAITSTAAFACAAASFFATTLCFALRSDAACAFERPSASASAKFANSTVNHSHSAIARMKPDGASAWPASAATHRIVVRMLPTYTQNITGLRNCVRGVSFLNESAIAGRTSAGSNIERAAVRAWPGCAERGPVTGARDMAVLLVPAHGRGGIRFHETIL